MCAWMMAVVALPIQYQAMHKLMPKLMLPISAKENIGHLNFLKNGENIYLLCN